VSGHHRSSVRRRSIYACVVAVDPLTSRSRLFDSAVLGHEHVEIAERVRQNLALVADGCAGSVATIAPVRTSSLRLP
jgi:hypothetical protein